MSIYIVSHKSVDLQKLCLPSGYKKIRVGNYNDLEKDEMTDNIGDDNISSKNSSYCELTALYWLWKNDVNSDYIGLCHYRRFFSKKKLSFNYNGILDEGTIRSDLKKYDVILPPKSYFAQGCKNAYLKCGYERDWLIVSEVLQDKYPDYVKYWDKICNGSGNYLYNMFVMSRENVDDYCKWLFDILESVESRVDISKYSPAEKRIFGYLSERLLGVWIEKNRLKIKTYRVINTESKVSMMSYIKQLIKYSRLSDIIKKMTFSIKKRR